MTSISFLSVLALAVLALVVFAGCQGNGHSANHLPDSTQPPVATAERPTFTLRSTQIPAVIVTPEPTTAPTEQADVIAMRSEESQQPTSTTPPPTSTPLPTATAPAPGVESNYTAVAAGFEYTCALKADGAAVCWGTERDGELPATVPAPDVKLKSISAGGDHACGIKTDGAVVCWGSNKFWDEYSGKADPPAGEFTSVSAGDFHTCGVRTDGTLDCWGLNYNNGEYIGLVDPPGGAYASVSTGWLHTCGVRTDGTATCWGDEEWLGSAINPPPGKFLSVGAAGFHSCGLRTNGELVCWGYIAVELGGDLAPAQEVELPTATFQKLTEGGRASCGITSDSSILCWVWRGQPLGRVNPPKGEFTDVSVGYPHACGLRTDGAIVCWVYRFVHPEIGLDPIYEVPGADSELFCLADRDGGVTCPGEPRFEMEAMRLSGRIIGPRWGLYSHNGIDYPCGYRLDDSLVCWTDDKSAFFDPAPTAVEAFAASDGDSVCWLLPDRTVACWGLIGSPKGKFRSISLGGSHEQFGCGIRSDNTLACWGNDSYGWGQLLPPAGEYKSVSAGQTCAIKMDDTVTCWGSVADGGSCWGNDPDDFQACVDHMDAGDPWTPLSGTFLSISWEKHYACGLYLDGTLECWGDNSHGRAAPPGGQFLSISTGDQHACAVRTDGTVACWGGKETYIGGGRAAVMPPGGAFRSVSVGGRPNHGTHYGCGVRTDGAPACWGNLASALLQALVAEEDTTTN